MYPLLTTSYLSISKCYLPVTGSQTWTRGAIFKLDDRLHTRPVFHAKLPCDRRQSHTQLKDCTRDIRQHTCLLPLEFIEACAALTDQIGL
jgi:hypothetical protein